MPDMTLQLALSDALRYWERRRILYNLVLVLVVVAVFLTNLPASRSQLGFNLFLALFVLAVLANVAYCAAYIVDVALQFSVYRATWLRVRWMVLAIGVAFAAVLAKFFAHGFLVAGD
ncbi:hypothetical protein [Dyella flagellata]|uniref:Uncharacterized protein n=1 Tax=Dyella flagellata TaxID=1867833 RepID=A0ABQ5XEY3_9GAMM|nr:hypothetical protein [Dyella flagellata]GLQ89791.1 hypothetical protein GCM10007898_33660 [Dyella flagellata]